MQLDIITPEKRIYSDTITMVTVPGTEGDFGVLPGHAPFISTIRPGIINIDSDTTGQTRLAVMGGIAEVTPEHCTVLAENALNLSDVTPQLVQSKTEEAEEALAAAQTDSAKKMAETKRQFAEVLKQAIAA